MEVVLFQKSIEVLAVPMMIMCFLMYRFSAAFPTVQMVITAATGKLV
jgi:hypothetical protein